MNRQINRAIGKLDEFGRRYPIRTALVMAGIAVLIAACANT